MAGRDIVCFVWLVRLMCRGVLRQRFRRRQWRRKMENVKNTDTPTSRCSAVWHWISRKQKYFVCDSICAAYAIKSQTNIHRYSHTHSHTRSGSIRCSRTQNERHWIFRTTQIWLRFSIISGFSLSFFPFELKKRKIGSFCCRQRFSSETKASHLALSSK